MGSISYIDLRIDGNDGWYVEWVHIDDGWETVTVTCDHFLDALATQRFYL